MPQTDGRQDAIVLLQKMQQVLQSRGEDRLPRRSDFSEQEVVQIKAHLGPFPRALEAAGLKSPRADAEEKRLQKRIAQKRRRTAAKIATKNEKE